METICRVFNDRFFWDVNTNVLNSIAIRLGYDGKALCNNVNAYGIGYIYSNNIVIAYNPETLKRIVSALGQCIFIDYKGFARIVTRKTFEKQVTNRKRKNNYMVKRNEIAKAIKARETRRENAETRRIFSECATNRPEKRAGKGNKITDIGKYINRSNKLRVNQITSTKTYCYK